MLNRDTPLQDLELGRIVVTAACLEQLRRQPDEPDLVVQARDIWPLLRRHSTGDWGDVSDPWVNDAALEDGSRILSVYTVRGEIVWIISDGITDVCPACWAGIGQCEPEQGCWQGDIHFRTDLPPRRLSTTVLLPSDY